MGGFKSGMSLDFFFPLLHWRGDEGIKTGCVCILEEGCQLGDGGRIAYIPTLSPTLLSNDMQGISCLVQKCAFLIDMP